MGGYIVGALDTQAFEERLESDWWPGLRGRYPDPARQACLRGDGEQTSSSRTPSTTPGGAGPELAARYPSHLHVNLEPRLQASPF